MQYSFYTLASLAFLASTSILFSHCREVDGQGTQISDTTATEISGEYQLTPAYPNLSFTRPVDYQHAGDGSNRIFVVEQKGIITVFEDDPDTSDKATFLDISGPVDDQSNEEGLLGLAFHPDYGSNGYFYVNYTIDNPARTRIARFSTSAGNPDQADRDSEVVLLEFEQPYGNHNGGQVSFGPDGYLYIAVGDGGSGGDPQGNGQNPATLLGTLLRIDVDQQADGKPYAIPADNPFAGNDQGYREEIYAYGLRNPWRFSFDADTDELWVGDVGQNQYEEIDIVEKGGNYGWNTQEAMHCFEPDNNCDPENLIPPVWEYDHSQGDVSVTGGFVYRGPTLPELQGKYIYADYASGRVWALDNTNSGSPMNTELMDASFAISSFGVNADNELFLCGFDGKIYRIQESS
ncbi:MAG: PQQ-dependent sugar dehydrogenase [Cyclobacteriaceae bacterium]